MTFEMCLVMVAGGIAYAYLISYAASKAFFKAKLAYHNRIVDLIKRPAPIQTATKED